MATSYTSLLGLALPVTGELQGTWGTTVNDEITSLLDSAVAGTTTLSADSDVVLTTTTGAANQARQSIILWTANGTVTRNITAPAQSKAYVVINASAGTQSIVIRGAGPTTGVTVAKGERVLVAWNGSDFVRIAAYGGTGEFTTVDTTNIEVTNIKAKDGTASASIADSTGVMSLVANPVLSGGTANGVLYLNASKVATSGSALTFDGSTFAVNSAASIGSNTAKTKFYSDSTYNGIFNGASLTAAESVYMGSGGLFFFTSGSEQMRLTSTGLGIGTSSPDGPLQVSFSNAETSQFNAGAATLYLTNTNTTNNNWAQIFFTDSDGGAAAATFGAQYTDHANDYAALSFATRGASGLSERMRLDSSGNLGIGTSSPSVKLDVQNGNATINRGTNSTILVLGGSPAANWEGDIQFVTSNTNTNWRLASNRNTSGAFTITPSTAAGGSTFTTPAVTLDSSGNLGIGTSSPAGKLTVKTGTNENLSVVTGGSGDMRLSALNDAGSATVQLSIQGSPLYFRGVGGAINATLDSSGNLGLGVTPSAWLSTVKAMQIGPRLGIYDTGSTGAFIYNAYINSAGNAIYSQTAAATLYDTSAGQHRWYTAPSGTAGNAISFTQAMTLDASGNLVVGATSGNFNSNNQAISVSSAQSGTTSAGLDIRGYATSDATIGQLTFFNGSNCLALISSARRGANNSGGLEFYTNSAGTLAERARITSGGILLVGTTSAPSIAGVTTDHAFVAGTGGRWVSGFRNTTTGTPWGLAVEYSGAAPNDTSSNFLYCYDNAPALRMNVRSNGGIANYSANDVNLSDRREKTNFAPAKSYLDTICAIPVQTFNYIDQSPDDPGLTLGVVAQDVQAVAPELVMESNWGTEDNPKMRLSIYQTDLQYALMKCVQELKAELDATKARLAALEAQP